MAQLDELIAEDTDGLLVLPTKPQPVTNIDRLVKAFQEVNAFVETHETTVARTPWTLPRTQNSAPASWESEQAQKKLPNCSSTTPTTYSQSRRRRPP